MNPFANHNTAPSKKLRLMVVGDLMLDHYTWGDVDRVSPEAPVVVLRSESEEVRLGGAGSVASLLAGFALRGVVAGVVGDDLAGRILRRLLNERLGLTPAEGAGASFNDAHPKHSKPAVNGQHPGAKQNAANADTTSQSSQNLCRTDPTRPTTLKQRFLGRTASRVPHQILRVDHESRRPLDREIEERLIWSIVGQLPHCDAVLISDYSKGICTRNLLSAVIGEARQRSLPVLVDPGKDADYRNYRGATLIKPNRLEAIWATGRVIVTPRDALAAAKILCRRYGFEAAVITLEAEGLVGFEADSKLEHFVNGRPREVCDVTGAGDTALAALGRALAERQPLAAACRLANAAAGLQVERVGVVPITWAEVLRAAGEDEHASQADQKTRRKPRRCKQAFCTGHGCNGSCAVKSGGPANLQCAPLPAAATDASKIVPLKILARLVEAHRRAGLKIVFTNGCFDLFHVGHLCCLAEAAQLGDVLVVAINSDESVRRLKGEQRPIVNQHDRAAMVASLPCVKHVVVTDYDNPSLLIEMLRPDVLVKGGTYRISEVVGREVAERHGAQVRVVSNVPGVSTSELVERIRDAQTADSPSQEPVTASA